MFEIGKVQVDYLNPTPGDGGVQLVGHGDLAAHMLNNGMNVNAMRPFVGVDGRSYMTVLVGIDKDGKPQYKNVPLTGQAATLRKDEWMYYDAAVVKAYRGRLVGVADLVAKGLTQDIPNGLGRTVLEYEDINDPLSAEMSMDGEDRAKKDRPQYTTKYLPLPIIHCDFSINTRILAASRNSGTPLDVTLAEMAARRIAEYEENMLFNGPGSSTYSFGGGTIYGYTNFISAQTGSLGTNWDESGATGATILADVLAMKALMLAAKRYGPWGLYISSNYETVLDKDFGSSYPKTIRARILEIEGISFVRVSDDLAADRVVMVQLTSDVVRMVRGLPIQTVEWVSNGNMVRNFKVMTISVPRLMTDQAGNCGIVVYSGT